MADTWAYFEVKRVYDGRQYKWHKINVFTRWLPSTRQTIVLVFDAKSPVSEHIPDPMLNPDVNCVGDPFWIYTRLLEEVIRLQDSAVWALRGQVRAIELQRRPIGKPRPDYEHLHDLARHAIHVSETLDVTGQTMEHVLMHHKRLMDSISDKDASQDVHSRLQFFESIIGSLRCRSVSNNERLLNEIQLAFNTVTQYDAGISVEIGRAAQSDSAAMKTIAFVTLAFLPPTFICALFSMSFFNYSDSGDWVVSNKFWVYWAFAVPATLTAFVLWYLWHERFSSAYARERQRVTML